MGAAQFQCKTPKVDPDTIDPDDVSTTASASPERKGCDIEMDPDDASTTASASPVPSNSTSSSSHPTNEEPDQVTGSTPDSSEEPPKAKKPKTKVLMLNSVFEGRAPVLLFPYTEACLAPQREMDRSVPATAPGNREVFFCHNYSSEYNAVLNTLRQGGMKRVEEDEQKWLVLWGRQPPAARIRSMTAVQKTNHFPGSWHLGDKGCLWKCIAAMQERFSNDFEITPIGYVVPEASASFALARQNQPAALWIWKPMTGSCGKGIRVFSSQDDSAEIRRLMCKPAIVQRYVPSPLLINGYKFDMRIYVTVVSYEPLKVYINTEGLVRLATQKYTEDPSTLSDRTRHLTNYSINKKSPLFVQNKDGEQQEGAQSSKWSLTELKAHFKEVGLDYDLMFASIKDVVVKTLLAVEPQMKEEWTKALNDPSAGWLARGPNGVHAASCFEMYGFDILMDTDLKAWLLEVNVYPSMSSGSPLDKRIKTKLVADTLTLVGLKTTAASKGNCSAGSKRPFSNISGDEAASVSALAKKAACLANCATPLEAVKLFDETAWDHVMESHDTDMRRGGFERIYPTNESSKYVPFMAEESYANIVLRKFYEAGGADKFWGKSATLRACVPNYVPKQINFQRT